jgi:sarcosine oxidase subunit beta
MRAIDAVVVARGVVGASLAYHLARRGWPVRVLERAGTPGEGSTGRATGGFRAQFATAVNVRLSLLAREQLLAFRDVTGVDPGYARVGYLWLARTPEVLAQLRAARAVQHAAGLGEAEELDRDGIRAVNPAVVTDDVLAAAWCPTDGYIRPLDVLRGFTEAARRLGAEFSYGAEVVAMECDGDGGRVSAVVTPRGRIACGAVVNAAGAWAAPVGALAGVRVPVTPLRRQVAMTVPTDALPPHAPMTIVADDGFHLRPREGRVLYAWPTPGDPADPWSAAVEPAWVAEAALRAAARVPVLRDVPVDPARCWAGLYEASPDKLAILGPAPGRPGLWLANGSSGHGVMHSPALGLLLAELMTDGRARSADVSALDPGRFEEGPVEVREIL